MPEKPKIRTLASSTAARLFAPDALRGLIITLMALDHASLFIAHKHSSGEMWGGPFPSTLTPSLFSPVS
jgi:uncharacterized membrane protein